MRVMAALKREFNSGEDVTPDAWREDRSRNEGPNWNYEKCRKSEGKLVSLNFVSWNLIGTWLERVDALRRVA